MESAVRRFARSILLIHLALLAVVLGVVVLATRGIEKSARAQALGQAQRRQEQIAAQTGRGIEGFYQNILSDMDLLPRTDDSQVERQVLPDLLTRTANKTPLGPRGVLIGFLLARQLEDRVSHLFVIDKQDMVPHALLREDLDEELKTPAAPTTQPARGPKWLPLPWAGGASATSRPATRPGTRPGGGGGGGGGANRAARLGTRPSQPPPRLQPSGPQPTRAELDVVDHNREWLKGVNAQAISGFEVFDAGGCNLIALPLGAKRTALLVAAVPVDKINEKYLTRLNTDSSTGAFLVDESLTVMAASRPRLVGANLGAIGDAQTQTLIDTFRRNGLQGTQLLPSPFKLGDHDFAPAMVTAVPIEVVPGRQWFLLVASPLAEVDQIVSGTFTRIVWWATFVTIAITAILVSTATQLIRSRAKFERDRLKLLHKELDRARQIQQAWLPRRAPAHPALDVAAVNYPAQHISGDFYNWFDLPDGRMAVAIGDVTGHGMSAAFLMATTQLLVRMTMQRITDPARCLAEVNRQLCGQVFNGQFVTMLLLVVDPDAGTLEMATAGHPAPLLTDAEGNLTTVPLEPQLVLGVEPDATYETERVELPPGSTLLLYTDGAPDVLGPDGSRFGSDGLLRAIPATAAAAHRGDAGPMDARGLVDGVIRAVNQFRGRTALGDDLTLVALRLRAGAAVPHAEPVDAIA